MSTLIRYSLLTLLFCVQVAISQAIPADSWIKNGQDYLKVTLDKDGMYAISGAELLGAGWEIGQIKPENLQLYFLGQEISIQLEGTEDGSFDASDKIVFYGQRNKGFLDSLVYRPTSQRMNSNHSLFSDESAYFLTVGNVQGKRMELMENQASNELSFVKGKVTVVQSDQYSFNNSIGLLPNLQQSYYEIGEGWSGQFLSADSSQISRIVQLPNLAKGTEKEIQLRLQLNGRSRNNHVIGFQVNGQPLDSSRFGDFEPFVLEYTVPENSINDDEVVLDFFPKSQTEFDWFSITSIEISYPKSMTSSLSNAVLYTFDSGKLIEGTRTIYDITNPYEIGYLSGSTLAANKSYFVDPTELSPKSLEAVQFTEPDQQANYYILTSPILQEGAEEYADYRSSQQGGAYQTQIIYPQELYDRYTYGLRNPEAIRRFADRVLDNATATKFLFLLGRPVTFPDVLKVWEDRDLVPSYGYPGSDALLTAGEGQRENIQRMATGRLNVTANSEIRDYLNKVKETEQAPIAQSWKKDFLHLSGGKTAFEITSLANMLKSIEDQAGEHLLGADIEVFRKKTFDEVEPIDISEEVNKGIGLLTFAGHGSANVLDLNIGYCSDPELGFANKGKYPVMYFNGCGVGNVFYRYDPLTTDWLLTPDKGAIAVFANSFWSYLFPTQVFLNNFYEKLFVDDESSKLTLGEIHIKINEDLSLLQTNDYIRANMHQVVLQGDPAIRFFPVAEPDYEVSNLALKTTDVSKPLAENERVLIEADLNNLGRYDSLAKVDVTITVQTTAGTESYKDVLSVPKRGSKIAIEVPVNGDLQNVTIDLNPENKNLESNEENNILEFQIEDWSEIGAGTSYPANLIPDEVAPLVQVNFDGRLLENGDYVSSNATVSILLTDENGLEVNEGLVSVYLSSDDGRIFSELSTDSFSQLDLNQILAELQLNLSPGEYVLQVKAQDLSGNQLSRPYEISFLVSANRENSSLVVGPNPLRRGADSYAFLQIVGQDNPKEVISKIVNSQGKVLEENEVNAVIGKNVLGIAAENLPAGVYFYQVQMTWSDEMKELTQKFVVH
ncbi:putative type IX secretion system sortase PorU2 [Jiulongibacter sp. NS-SX5]|uniref:putative type IX secretion system sortase PorU2 n=1 Tax=Jiulongibacter sp. NS-SX5 TaxID=3463854 RepID=UPI0040580001